ncbi:hypothetical protein KAK07_10750 [Ideonella sp. 4Y16]|uniref:MSHA biogenesis protein MshQ n=1 Tax=Ideonella alba TaxID=2824118 RepID=A0A940YFD7_9BURK|nr:DUF6701 domain-containing protein [Ideonella alba]MBQ0931512.1 hypothetical protein [Ideonella alba]MBQ0943817.1 hypothetical protein [Ideonella alba]
MSKIVRLLLHGLLACLLLAGAKVSAATFTASSVTYSWDTVSTSAGVIGDDVSSGAISLPFSVTVGGVTVSTVYISSNGLVAFSGANTAYNNTALPTGTAPLLLPYWDDLRTDVSGASVVYGTLGSAPNRRFVISWNSVALFSNTAVRLSFQAVLYEYGDVEFRYQSMGDTGSSATIGLQLSGSDYTQWSLNTPAKASSSTAIRFSAAEGTSPGGVSGHVWWGRAGSIGLADGAGISTWTNHASYSRNLTGSTTAPVFRNTNARNINFNPTVEFTSTTATAAGAQYFTGPSFLGTSTWTRAHYVAVGYPVSSTQNNWLFYEDTVTPSGYVDGRLSVHFPWNPHIYWDAGNCCTTNREFYTPPNLVNGPSIYLFSVDTTTTGAPGAGKQGIRQNGAAAVVAGDGTANAQISFTGNNGNFRVGWPGWDGNFQGYLAEGMMFLGNTMTPALAVQLESYLAVKYGITLGSNGASANAYVHSGGSTIWAAGTGLHYNVVGVGRDDLSKLDQRISRSVNSGDQITITTSATVPSTASTIAPTTGTAFSADRSFVLAGDNNGTVESTVSISSGTLAGRARSGRLWRVQTTGTVPTQLTVCIPDTLIPASFLTGTLSDLQLNAASDANLSTNVASVVMAAANCPGTGVGVSTSVSGRAATLSAAQLSALGGTGYFSVTRRQLDHIEVTTDATSSVTCQPTTYTIRACADAACSGYYVGGLSGNLAITGTGVTVTYPSGAAWSIAAGSSTTTIQAQVTSTTTATVGLTGLSVTPGNAKPVFCGLGVAASSTNSCSFTPASSGFLFDVPSHRSGESQTVSITAVKNTGGSCGAAFSGTKSVTLKCSYLNPTTGTLPALVNGTATNAAGNASAACDAAGKAFSLSFNTSGVASISVQYRDAGQVALSASYTGSGADAGLNLTGSDSFVAAPYGYTFSGLPSTVKAGDPFALTVTAVNSLGSATPNYGLETTPLKPALSFYRAKPGGSGAVDGSFTVGSAGSVSAASVTFSGNAWSEVGRLEATARLASGNYLGSGISVAGTTGAWTYCAHERSTCTLPSGIVATVRYISRGKMLHLHGISGSLSCDNTTFGQDPDYGFEKDCYYAVQSGSQTTDPGSIAVIPHHLDLQTSAACGSFSYAGQPFGVTVTARNAVNGVTLNYDGSAATSPNQAQAISFVDASGNSTGSLAGSLAASAFTAGVGSGTAPVFSFTSKLTPEQTITVRGVDANAVSSQGYTEGSMMLRSGRLVVSNAFGTDKSSLQLPLQVQAWSGMSWVLNSDDSCTSIPTSAVVRPRVVNHNGSAASWTSAVSAVSLSAGQGAITLAPPSPSGTGTVDVAVHLGSGTAADQSCLASHSSAAGAGLPWLRSRNGSCAATWDRDPSARATFGVYAPESRKLMQIRELF